LVYYFCDGIYRKTLNKIQKGRGGVNGEINEREEKGLYQDGTTRAMCSRLSAGVGGAEVRAEQYAVERPR
jgi:hypothetical protein